MNDDTFEGQYPVGEGLSLDDVLGREGEPVRVQISAKRERDGGPVAFAVFEEMDPETLRRYRTIYHGLGHRKGKPRAAQEFVAREKFRSFENLNIGPELAAYNGSEKDWFLKSRRGQMLFEYVVPTYLGIVSPDVDDLKE